MTDLVSHPHTPTTVDHRRETFTREQVELIKRTVAQGTNDDELGLFLETAKRRGLDPFSGQIHAIMRWDGRAGREVMKIQTGIDGYRSLADRTGLIEYVEGPDWTADGDTWVDVWLSDEPPAAARFTVKRKDRSRAETRVATWREYAQRSNKGELTRAWRELSATMLGKVAEAQALRTAFPETLGGIYTVEEMDQAHAPEAETSTPAVEVDHPEERRALLERFRPWYNALGEEERGAVWQEIGDRFYGSGSIGDRFAATPIHVLEEIVETYVDAGGEDDVEITDAEVVDDEPATDEDAPGEPEASEGTDTPEEGAEPESADEIAVSVDDTDPEPEPALEVEADPGPSDEDPAAAEAARSIEEPPDVDLADVPDPSVDEPGYAAWLAAATAAYATLNVADANTLVRKRYVDLDDGRRLAVPNGDAGLAMIGRWEANTGSAFRKTVRAALKAEGWSETVAVPPPAVEDDEEEAELDVRRNLLRRWKASHRELSKVDEQRARKVLASRIDAGAEEDALWSTFDLTELVSLVEEAEIARRECVPF